MSHQRWPLVLFVSSMLIAGCPVAEGVDAPMGVDTGPRDAGTGMDAPGGADAPGGPDVSGLDVTVTLPDVPLTGLDVSLPDVPLPDVPFSLPDVPLGRFDAGRCATVRCMPGLVCCDFTGTCYDPGCLSCCMPRP